MPCFRTRLTILLAAGFLATAAGQLSAQDPDRPPATDTEAAQTPARSSPLLREYGLDGEAGRNPRFRRLLDSISEDALRELLSGAEPGAILLPSGQTLADLLPNALGGNVDELVLTPLNPCRVIDTRNAVGAFAAGATRNYNLIGITNYSGLGGSATDCGIPTDFGGGITSANRVRGLVLNVVGTQAGGLGNFQAWPTNQSPPTASILNYGTTQSVANGLVLKTCDALCIDVVPPFSCGDPCPAGDLSIKANASPVHLVVDVIGYLTAASIGSSSQDTETAFVSLSSGACANLASVGLTNSSNVTRGVVCTGITTAAIDHTLGTQDNFWLSIGTASAASCLDADTPFESIDNNFPTTSGTDQRVVSAIERSTLAANTSQTYYLNAQINAGASAGDGASRSRLVCWLEP